MRSSFLPKYERKILRISALASKERSNKKIKALYYTNYGLFDIIGKKKVFDSEIY
jgi:hypothetical protein